MSLAPPFGWVGGKSRFAAQIIERFPEHRLYCEVFAGGLSVLYAKEPSKIEVVNDLNGELINLHLQIKRHPVSLSNYLRNMLISRELFHMVKRGVYPASNDIERAAAYLYRLMYSFGAQGATFLMSRDKPHKRICRDYSVHSRRLRQVRIERMDFAKLIKDYDKPYTLFYVDPPYYRTEHYYEGGRFAKADHERLRDCLANTQGKWLLSYNDCPEVRELYKDYKIDTISARYSFALKRGSYNELLIANY